MALLLFMAWGWSGKGGFSGNCGAVGCGLGFVGEGEVWCRNCGGGAVGCVLVVFVGRGGELNLGLAVGGCEVFAGVVSRVKS